MKRQVLTKIDVHIHVTTQSLEKPEVFTYASRYMSKPEEMIPHLTHENIEHAIIMSTSEKENNDSGTHNEIAKTICSKYPSEFSWCCTIDEQVDSEKTVYERIKQYQQEGAVGVGEFCANKLLDDAFVKEVLEAAEKLEMPVTIHMSPAVGMGYGVVDHPGLPLLEEVLVKYPNLKLIGHSAPIWNEISKDAATEERARNGYPKEKIVAGGRLIECLRKYAHFYCDLSAYSGCNALLRDEAFALSFLEEFQDQLMFGTDYTHAYQHLPLGEWLDEQYLKEKLSHEAYQKICRDNADKVFRLRLNQ